MTTMNLPDCLKADLAWLAMELKMQTGVGVFYAPENRSNLLVSVTDATEFNPLSYKIRVSGKRRIAVFDTEYKPSKRVNEVLEVLEPIFREHRFQPLRASLGELEIDIAEEFHPDNFQEFDYLGFWRYSSNKC